ncbi:hypothetical protein Tsp_08841 [Trichinella spiralis]|uniref:hypothetical protein n=1 Tax=Trichinella spiralis TaxID=6334 RepID=UPI0001EFE888|nr:hypothetical protein Tsp_08841 [Trichinella spiralis]
MKICEFCVLESSCFITSVQYSMLHEKPGIDKSIVPYFGHHPAMFMKEEKMFFRKFKISWARDLTTHSAGFRRHVVLSLLQSHRKAPLTSDSEFRSQLPDIRIQGVSHMVSARPQGSMQENKYAHKTQRTCAKLQCSSTRRAEQSVLPNVPQYQRTTPINLYMCISDLSHLQIETTPHWIKIAFTYYYFD